MATSIRMITANNWPIIIPTPMTHLGNPLPKLTNLSVDEMELIEWSGHGHLLEPSDRQLRSGHRGLTLLPGMMLLADADL